MTSTSFLLGLAFLSLILAVAFGHFASWGDDE